MLPPAASTRNLVDMLASATRKIMPTPCTCCWPTRRPQCAGYCAAAAHERRRRWPWRSSRSIHTGGKPVVVGPDGERMIQRRWSIFAQSASGVPFPERASGVPWRYWCSGRSSWRGKKKPGRTGDRVDPAKAQAILNELQLQPGEFLPQKGCKGCWPLMGLPRRRRWPAPRPKRWPWPRDGLPGGPEDCRARRCTQVGCGRLLLNLTSPEAVSLGFAMLLDRVQAARQGPPFGGHGAKDDPGRARGDCGLCAGPQFGPVLMFGSGGVEVEGCKMWPFALAPPTADEVDYLLAQTWAGRKLAGYRSLPPADEAAVRQVLVRLGQLAPTFRRWRRLRSTRCVSRPGPGQWPWTCAPACAATGARRGPRSVLCGMELVQNRLLNVFTIDLPLRQPAGGASY